MYDLIQCVRFVGGVLLLLSLISKKFTLRKRWQSRSLVLLLTPMMENWICNYYMVVYSGRMLIRNGKKYSPYYYYYGYYDDRNNYEESHADF